MVILSCLNLMFDFLAVLGNSTFQAVLPGVIVNGLILAYCLWPTTREAFEPA